MPSQKIIQKNSGNSGQMAQAGRDVNQSQIHSFPNDSDSLGEIISNLILFIEESDLTTSNKRELVHYFNNIKYEAKYKEPNKDSIENSLSRVKGILQDVNGAISEGEGILDKLKPLLMRLIKYLGLTTISL